MLARFLCFSKSVLQTSIDYVQFISGTNRDYLLTLDGSFRKKRDETTHLLAQTARSSSASSARMDSSRSRSPGVQSALSSSGEEGLLKRSNTEEIDLESQRISFSEFMKVQYVCILAPVYSILLRIASDACGIILS